VLRNKADVRTVIWVLLAPTVVAIQYARPELVPYLGWVSAYFALACGVIAHNHNHCGTFKSKKLNQAFANFISIFYGYPTFAWVPTHNLNHHKYVNAEGDATITWRHTNRHNALVAATYFFVSAYYQSEPIKQYIAQAKANNPRLYRSILMQYAIWGGAHLGMLALGVALYGPAQGAKLWAFSMGLPALFSLWTIMLFNYDQHAHTDPFSKYDHSRSFTSPVLNFLLFNNGYHYVHHEHPGVHWTTLRALHEEVEPRINPVLVQKSVWWYWFKQYALTPFFPKLGTVQLGAGPMHPPQAALDGQPVEAAG
jgi:fatty acid desaturase